MLIAVTNRPMFIEMPAPVARTSTGNNSGKYSGNQPKNSVATSPCANTVGKNDGSSGAVSRNIAQVSTVAPRLIKKYESRRPIEAASGAPRKLPIVAPMAHHHCVVDL